MKVTNKVQFQFNDTGKKQTVEMTCDIKFDTIEHHQAWLNAQSKRQVTVVKVTRVN